MLGRPVVVAGNRAGADIDAFTDSRVAEVREVIRFGATPHRRLLQFDEVSDVRILTDARLRPEVRERPDARTRTNPRLDDQAETVDPHAVSDFGVDDADVGLDHDIRSHGRPSLEVHARMDHRVRADRYVRSDPGGGRIDHCDTGGHQLAGPPRSHDCCQVGELLTTVHSQNLGRVVQHDCLDPKAAFAVHPDEIWKVILVLRVSRPDLADRGEQRREIEGVDAAVDLPDPALLLGRVAMFDNR